MTYIGLLDRSLIGGVLLNRTLISLIPKVEIPCHVSFTNSVLFVFAIK